MELRHLAMVNWHFFDAEDIALGGHVGILGENRSGKSTILDMIQVVLTGASRSYLRLNAVAGDSGRTRSGKRSVHGYCLGTLGEGEVRRDEALTYLALGFEDREGVRPPVSIGLAMAARKGDPSEAIYGRFVAVGRVLTTADFIDQDPEGPVPRRWDAMRARLVAHVGAGCFFNHHDSAIRYVREYMRYLAPPSLRIQASAEANAAAMLKAVVNAMTLNHGLDATDFVRGFILEESPIRIGELRASIETYKGVSAAIVAMRRKLEVLRAIGADLDAYEATRQRKTLEDWTAKRARWLAARMMNCAHKARIAHARRMMAADREDLDLLDEVIQEAEAEIGRIDAALAAHQAKTGRDGLAEVLRRLDEQDGARRSAIARRATEARLLGAVCDDLAGPDPGAAAAARTYARLAASAGAAPDTCVLREAEAALRALLPQIDDWTLRERREAASTVRDLGTEIAAIRETLAQNSATGRGVHLADDTRRLMRRLESAGMDARPLCDLVEVADPAWTYAAEALLGRDREAVFVRRNEIHAATRLFKDGRREFPRASLVSLNKLGEFRGTPGPRTFPTVFRSDDRDALAFLQRRYGTVRLAETLDAFNEPGRALMKDGLYDDGLVRSHRAVEQRDYKIGKTAQAAGVVALQDRMADLSDAYAAAEIRERDLGRIAAALDALEQGRPLADLLDEGAADAAARSTIVGQLAAIDAQGDRGLRERRRAQDDLLRVKKTERGAIGDHNTKYIVDIKVGDRDLGGGEGVEGSNLDLGVARKLYAEGRRQHDYRAGANAYRERLVRLRPAPDTRPVERLASLAGAHGRITREAIAAAEAERDRMHRQDLALRRALRDYFGDPDFGASAQVGPESELLGEIRPWLRLLVADLEGNEIRCHEDRAREAAERIRSLVRGEFLNLLIQRIEKMKRDIDQLNRFLRDHPFHNERYSFHRTEEAAFKPVLRIVEIARLSDDVLDMLFHPEIPDEFPHREVVKTVERLLEDKDQDVAAFEDYRRFYTFEIHMEDVETGKKTRWETRRGTGSGAEQQVPLYVAIGASLASVFATSQREAVRDRGMSPALFDEAFSKLDGKNQRQMMSFYEKLGLQVLIAAPMEKKAAIQEHMETIVEVDRIGDRSFTTVVRLKARARDALTAMNPDHMTDADIAAALAAE